MRNRLWESIKEALEAAANLSGVPQVLGKPIPSWQLQRQHDATSSTTKHSSSSSGGTNAALARSVSGSGAPVKDPAGVPVDPSKLPAGMEYLAPPAPAGATVEGPAGIAATKSSSASTEHMLLALSGICPISVVCSEAAGGAASPACADGEALEAPVTQKLLVGCMARPECGNIR